MSIQDRIRSRIKGRGRGATFTPKDFLDLGSRAAVDQALSRLARDGTIRRLSRGVYDFPKKHPRFGHVLPSADSVARAVAGPAAVLQSSGAKAANRLGLSTQVPGRVVFLTDGRNRDVRVGNMSVRLKQVPQPQLVGAGRVSGDVLQALRHIGRKNVDDAVVGQLRARLSSSDKDQLRRDATANRHQLADWLVEAVDQIATRGP